MYLLRFDKSEIEKWAGQYDDPNEELIDTIVPRAKARGFFDKPEFLLLCRWKTPRSQPECEKNSEEFIKAITETALNTANEQLRIEVLTLLKGVAWPTASVILHFGHKDPYPILDYRALWSLGIDTPPESYDFVFWWDYAQFCRQLAMECNVTMRDLDRALWQFSKENQITN